MNSNQIKIDDLKMCKIDYVNIMSTLITTVLNKLNIRLLLQQESCLDNHS